MVERLKEFISHSGISVRAFAIACGIPQNTLSNQLNGIRELSLKTVCAISATFPDLSAEWLLRGEGSMIKGDVQPKEADRLNKLVDTIATLQDVINDKSASLAAALDRIKQLEAQLK